ncbi:Protein phosphatase methylesterase 1 [Coccidioides posadasii str. Silveira]|uniref:Protein phosphatase methylesterase 1 n=3 Tax=Coccidioides posadasii TaxID=199306 RepID=E9DDU9_COCPS|nr:protein phosphatase methylesterase 1 [Coccidioides posadasii str. Silveira]KMM70268.1 protein phosphatase methylesterase 1 [Coccidioides posadasii RMSCC 3488]QVM13524.1 Protein phosphatase methylesterase 1 [Coccidioides posadasii str. Silveira]
MSGLHKSFAKSRLARLPPDVPMFDERQEHEHRGAGHGEFEDDSSSASSASSTGTVRPSPSQNLFARNSGAQAGRADISSLPWMGFFERELFLEEDIADVRIVHHAYIISPTDSGPLFVMHHGAGSSGLSFAACAQEIRKILPKAGILSLDARDHGLTTSTRGTQDDTGNAGSHAELDLRLETLSRDLVFVINQAKVKMKWESMPPLVLVGHSLGGAVVTDVAKNGELGSDLLAYAVLDVVEGSAMDALQSMETYLSTRPSSFPSLSTGITWHLRSRTIRNTTSARVSVPGLLHEDSSDACRPWKWRTNLAYTKPFWENWFIGLSKKFLEARGGKLLLLAGTDRLDKELIIGQMQGKYQLQVFPEAGHFIHEDQPAKTAQILVDFYKRNDRSALVLPPKVGDMMASKAMAKGLGLP